MNIYEYGKNNKKKFLFIATAALEPYWAFETPIRLFSRDYHIFAVVADGHEIGETNDFISIEKTVADMTEELRKRGVEKFDMAYGLSMGGAIIMRFLTTGGIPVEHAIIDGGIMPYSYPKLLCKLILLRDFVFAYSITRSRRLLELVAPPEKYTQEGHDSKAEYDALMEFYKTYSSRTIRNVFWSANNYDLPCPPPAVDTNIEYWYGEGEKKGRKKDIRFIEQYFPQVEIREISGYGHGELVMVYPKILYQEVSKTKASHYSHIERTDFRQHFGGEQKK